MTTKTELIEAIRAMDDGMWFAGLCGAGMPHLSHALGCIRADRDGLVSIATLQELHDQMARVVRYRDS